MVELVESQYNTRLKVDSPVDCTVILADLVTNEVSFMKKFAANEMLDYAVKPFQGGAKRVFLVMYPPRLNRPGKGKGNWKGY